MKIESAKYLKDDSGQTRAVRVVHDGGNQVDVPIDGCTWINAELGRWQKDGGTIQAADEQQT